jgi:putative aldouronate transport system permease protein
MYGIVLAFKEYRFMDGILKSPWNNFQNFKDLFGGRDFPTSFKNTIILSVYRIIFGFPAPIILALLLNEVRSIKFKKMVQTLSYLPHFLSWVILAGVFMELLSPSRGPVNQLITGMGGKAIYFFGDPKWFRTLLVTTGIWQSVGWGSIIYLATIAGVDVSLYEAAYVDGANRWKQMVHITLPALVPVITIMAIFTVGGIISDNFDQVFNFYNPAVYSVADVLSTYTYRIGIGKMEYDLATATGLFVNVINFTLLVITNKIVKKYSEYGIW